ncbi:MAG TPA: hypothetical protein VGX00_02720 [Thermoplasmata archaeon]|nr:hypothetical protein [Thermoplasmata archaeon]
MGASGGPGASTGFSHHPPPEIGHLPPMWAPIRARPSLPVGVAIVAVLIGILGIVLLLGGGLFLLRYYAGSAIPNDVLIIHSVDAIGAALLILLGAVFLALATALWRQEAWALYTTIAVSFGGLAFLFFTASITYLFLILLVVFVYLLMVRRHFY